MGGGIACDYILLPIAATVVAFESSPGYLLHSKVAMLGVSRSFFSTFCCESELVQPHERKVLVVGV